MKLHIADTATLPLADAIKIGNGTRERHVYLFESAACVFYQKLQPKNDILADAAIRAYGQVQAHRQYFLGRS